MFRCVLATLMAVSFLGSAAAQALPQQPYLKRNFTAAALRGEMVFLNPPDIRLNGQLTRLSPGSHIRNRDNLLVLSGTLVGQQATVHYTVDDITHQVMDVWLLRPEEIDKTPWPESPAEARSWQFDFANQRWLRP